MDPELNWAKILDPDPNSMYLHPEHCANGMIWKKVCLCFRGTEP